MNDIQKELKGLFGERHTAPFLKIYKSSNDKSTLHVSPSLHYWEENTKKEHVYKGSVVFSITEHFENKKTAFLQFFIKKETAKVLLTAILNRNFKDIYGDSYEDYGMKYDKNEKHPLRRRVLKIKMTNRNQYLISIDDSPGVRGKNGKIDAAGKSEKSVSRYIPEHEAMELAHEVYDYIRDQELIGAVKGLPLITYTPKTGSGGQRENQKERPPKEERKEAPPSTYVIPINPWKGQLISSLSSDLLKGIMRKTKNRTEEVSVDLYNESLKELTHRGDV
ncbi:hypothetical protein IMZ31_23065 (plasmid) [Pontibacillus sp. ALD_SL1]|uniref:hypothetical protein n=1 Tax=Pontibacillus sp. ALD_SL1 TaxID=2777185 RepID=UPI001A95D3F6|nr:hypothetical protein [Pontibacillus sp. ALD_SL1]QST02335.1 hypothetical protein IMZ31_23065 [Pontibacillus sp. ALD_SL1]